MKTILNYFFKPYLWQEEKLRRDQTFKMYSLLLIYFVISSISNSRWEFPHFYLFFITFTFIFLLALFSENHFSKEIKRIRGQTLNKSGFKYANVMYTKFEESKLISIIALVVVIIFGFGGIAIYSTLVLTPTLLLCLLFFSVVVYLSIVGYVQYMLLLFYIINLARDKVEYQKVGQELTDKIPAEINWLHRLTKLTHFYRTIFFTVGTFYIAAFWFYCNSPEFAVDLGHWIHYLLWLIIFIAIVIAFPIISIIEFTLIKKLVAKVKYAYISEAKNDLRKKEINAKPEIEYRILGELFSSSVLVSANYPITSKIGVTYAVLLAILNLVGSIDTAIQLGNQLLFP